jgi:MFS family permease
MNQEYALICVELLTTSFFRMPSPPSWRPEALAGERYEESTKEFMVGKIGHAGIAESGPVATLLRVFLPFACGYFLSYLFRTVNAVIAPDLVAAVRLTAADLGLLTSIYFLTFAACQIPLGMFLDRFGPRRVEAVLLLFAALGALLFAVGTSATTLLIGRSLIGLGVSGCLMAAFQAFVLWFPKPRLPLVNGCIMACGGVGALMATAPVEALLQITDWRGLFIGLSLLTLTVAVLIFVTVPEYRREDVASSMTTQLRGVVTVFGDRLFWRLAPITMLAHSTLLSLQGLWAGLWLRDVAGLERTAVATHLLVTAAAMLIGYLIIGAIGERLQRHGTKLIRVLGWGILAFMLVQLGICMGVTWAPMLLWALFGFCGAASILSFAVLSQSFPSHLAGRINTALNLLIFIVAFGSQYGIGEIINLWPTSPSGGYAIQAYQTAFGLMLGLEILAFLWFLWPTGPSEALPL